MPWYSPNKVSGGSISISSRSAAEGSSSTRIAMFFMAFLKRRGMVPSASATSCSKSARSMGLLLRRLRGGLFRRALLLRLLLRPARLLAFQRFAVVALLGGQALVAER